MCVRVSGNVYRVVRWSVDVTNELEDETRE